MTSENSGRKPPGRQGASARLDAWIAQVFGDKGLPRNALHVAQALRQFLNHKSLTAWPAVGTLARLAGLSVRTVQRLLRAMKGAGHLSIEDNAARFGCNLFGARLLPETESALAKQAADRREAEPRAPEPPLKPSRETGSADLQAEHRRAGADRWRNAERPRQEAPAPASRPAPADREHVDTESPLWNVLARLYRSERGTSPPQDHRFGWRFPRRMVEAARVALAQAG